MNDFQKSVRRHPGRKLVNYIMQGDEAPVTYVQRITTLEDKRNNPTSLGQGQLAGGIVRIKSIDQVLTKLFPKGDIEFHGQTIGPRGLPSGHTQESAMPFTERKKALTLTGLIGDKQGRNISENGILDTGVRAGGKEQ